MSSKNGPARRFAAVASVVQIGFGAALFADPYPLGASVPLASGGGDGRRQPVTETLEIPAWAALAVGARRFAP